MQVPLLQPQLLQGSITCVQVLLTSAEKQFGDASEEMCAALVAPTLYHLVPVAMHLTQQDELADKGEKEQMWYTVAGFLMMLLEPGVWLKSAHSCGLW
jgi:hypothetical protein